MSGVSITLDDADVQALFGRMIAKAQDLTAPLDAVGFSISQRVASTFHDQRDPWGSPWSPLSAVTIALRRRRRKGGSEQVLRDTGALANSITHRVVGNAVEIGPGPSTSDYAATHQFGRADNRIFGKALAPIPARPFLPIRDGQANLPTDWMDELRDILASHMEAA